MLDYNELEMLEGGYSDSKGILHPSLLLLSPSSGRKTKERKKHDQ